MAKTIQKDFSMTQPKACILRTDGSNCDEELYAAFEEAGCKSSMVHINEFRAKQKKFTDYQIIALPGGFTYGDDIASGKILAVEMISFFKEELDKYIEKGGYLFGVCNGFQTLVRTGLLPFQTPGKMSATLTNNDSGHFECRWVKIKAEKSKASYLDDLPLMEIPVNHGEGKFFASPETLKKIEQSNLVVLRYTDNDGNPTQKYPENPNGAFNAIAGITNSTGRILGLMPHPEKFINLTNHPNWRRKQSKKADGLIFYKKIVQFVSKS